jgi:phosphatidylserine decarboxylase
VYSCEEYTLFYCLFSGLSIAVFPDLVRRHPALFSENHLGETLVKVSQIFLAVTAIQTGAAGLLIFLIDWGKAAVGILPIEGGGGHFS